MLCVDIINVIMIWQFYYYITIILYWYKAYNIIVNIIMALVIKNIGLYHSITCTCTYYNHLVLLGYTYTMFIYMIIYYVYYNNYYSSTNMSLLSFF